MTTVSQNTPIVNAHGLNHRFGKQVVLQDLDLEVLPGQFICLLGASGCGKSTLLRLLAGLEPRQAGQLELAVAKDQCGFVFQQPNLLPWRRVLDNVALPLQLNGVGRSSRRQTAMQKMLEVGLSEDDARKWPRMLSGGMQMRASLARTLVTRPELMLLDEPFAALDEILRQRLNEDVRRWHQAHGWSTLFVTHNVAEAVFLADRILILRTASPGRNSVADEITLDFDKRTAQLRETVSFQQKVAEVSSRFRQVAQPTEASL